MLGNLSETASRTVEKGVDLRCIQDLLGHESSKPTEIYTHNLLRFCRGHRESMGQNKKPLERFGLIRTCIKFAKSQMYKGNPEKSEVLRMHLFGKV